MSFVFEAGTARDTDADEAKLLFSVGDIEETMKILDEEDVEYYNLVVLGGMDEDEYFAQQPSKPVALPESAALVQKIMETNYFK